MAAASERRLLRLGVLVPVALYSVTVLLVLLGAVVLHVAAFRDRARGRPRCPKCWYDMTGSRGFVCPECGHDAARPRNLYRTRRHGARVLLGALLIVSGLSLGAVPTVQEQGWSALIPTSALMLVLPWTDNPWVFEEIDARVSATNPEWFARRRGRHEVSTMTVFYARRCATLLRSPRDADLRLKASQTLFDLCVRDAKVEAALIAGTIDREAKVRSQSVLALTQMAGRNSLVDDSACAIAVARCLKDSSPVVSQAAGRFFRSLDEPIASVVPELLAALEDERWEVRAEACATLAQFGPLAEPAVPLLMRLMDESPDRVATFAIVALGRIGPGAAPAIEPLAIAARRADRRGAAALTALTRLGSTAKPAAGTLVAMLLDPTRGSEQRTAVAAALLTIDPYDPAILRAIESAAQEDIEPLRLHLAREMTRVRADEPQQVRIMLACLRSASAEVRQEAALALGRLAPLRADEIAALAALAEDSEFIGREQAQIALSRAMELPGAGSDPAAMTEGSDGPPPVADAPSGKDGGSAGG